MSQVRTLTPNFTVVTFKMWAYAPKIVEIGNFWYKFAHKRYTPLSDFLYKIWLGRESLVRSFMPNFTTVGFKMWAYSPQNRRNWYFLNYRFAQKGYTPLSDFFYKIWLGGGSPRSAPSYQISPFWLEKCGPAAAKIAKNRCRCCGFQAKLR